MNNENIKKVKKFQKNLNGAFIYYLKKGLIFCGAGIALMITCVIALSNM